MQEPKWRVKSLLMKLDSDDRHDTDYANKFVRKAEEIFAGLPKPKDWHTQEEIAGAVEVSSIQTISNWCDDLLQSLANEDCNKFPRFRPPDLQRLEAARYSPTHTRGFEIGDNCRFTTKADHSTRALEHRGWLQITTASVISPPPRAREHLQARAIRRAGELYNQIEPATGKNNQYEQMKRDGTDTLHYRTQAATDAGLSERQRKMAERIQARAIRRYGELLKQIEPDKGGRPLKTYDATDIGLSRSQAAREAGISEWQKVTAMRIANIPAPEFEQAVDH